MVKGLGISKADLDDTALLFAALHGAATFRPRDLAEFLTAQHLQLDEEACDELLGELVTAKALRQIGPGVYAKIAEGAP